MVAQLGCPLEASLHLDEAQTISTLLDPIFKEVRLDGGIMKRDESIEAEFSRLVNMTPRQLTSWLQTTESKEVGQKTNGGESIGHKSAKKIAEILEKKKPEFTEGDRKHMQRVVSYIKRHLAQRPDRSPDELESMKWRYSLMNWGHDPLK